MKSMTLFFVVLLTTPFVYAAPTDVVGRSCVKAAPDTNCSCTVATAAGEACFMGDIETQANADIAGTLAVAGLVTPSGGLYSGLNAITGADTLAAEDCGRITTVTAGVDGATITLPEASTVLGCTLTLVYIGADGGALLDVSPLDSDADGIEGSCTLAASVVTFSGTADADVGLTKATILTGDFMQFTAVSAAMWVMTDSQGICANN